jgi:DNA-binding GntR family transcriptional regulator
VYLTKPVYQAIRVLADEGKVTTVRGWGTFVAS